MKSRIILFILFISILGYAQSVQVINKIEINNSNNAQFFYPTFNNSGSQIIFTSETYKGIWLFNTTDKQINKISDAEGVGFLPLFSKTDDEIICRTYKFENMKRVSSLLSINVNTGIQTVLLENSKNLYYPMATASKNLFALENDKPLMIKNDLLKQQPDTDDLLVFIDKSNLVVEQNGVRRILNPLGEGNYIWPSFSQSGDKILFTKAGEGTFICDLDGNILYELGRANYPRWAKNDDWIVFMDDYDDGVQYTSSEIKALNISSGSVYNLTQTEDVIEMYPDYSSATDEVVYHTTDGKIIKLTLKFN